MLTISCNFGGLKVSESGQNKQLFNQTQATTLIMDQNTELWPNKMATAQ